MTNETPWEYKEDPIHHEETGAIGAKTPQGDVVYGDLAKNYLTPIDDVNKLSVPSETTGDTTSVQKIMDTAPETWLTEQEAQRQTELDRIKKERDTAMQAHKDDIASAKESYDAVPSMEDRLSEEQDAAGIPQVLEAQKESLAEIRRLRESAIGLEQQRDAAIAALGQQGIATPFITGQQAKIENSFNRRIATVAAQEGVAISMYNAQMQQVEQARALISDTINAATFDTQLELDRINTFLDFNREELAMLDTEYQNSIQESQRYWENKLAQDKADMEAKLNFMITTEGKAGITIDDSLDEAIAKFSKYTGAQIPSDVKGLMAQYNPSGANILKTDSFEQALAKVAKMPVINEEYNKLLTLDQLERLPGDLPFGTTVGEAIAMGLTPEPSTDISPSLLNKLASEGVPPERANWIQANLNAGYSYKDMLDMEHEAGTDPTELTELAEQMGTFRNTLAVQGTLNLDVDIRSKKEFTDYADTLILSSQPTSGIQPEETKPWWGATTWNNVWNKGVDILKNPFIWK
jgi:hypothetical protein